MKLFCLRIKSSGPIAKSDIWFFEILLLKDSLYFIVFLNILMKLMRKIGQKMAFCTFCTKAYPNLRQREGLMRP